MLLCDLGWGYRSPTVDSFKFLAAPGCLQGIRFCAAGLRAFGLLVRDQSPPIIRVRAFDTKPNKRSGRRSRAAWVRAGRIWCNGRRSLCMEFKPVIQVAASSAGWEDVLIAPGAFLRAAPEFSRFLRRHGDYKRLIKNYAVYGQVTDDEVWPVKAKFWLTLDTKED